MTKPVQHASLCASRKKVAEKPLTFTLSGAPLQPVAQIQSDARPTAHSSKPTNPKDETTFLMSMENKIDLEEFPAHLPKLAQIEDIWR
jgi:hypothetical protein